MPLRRAGNQLASFNVQIVCIKTAGGLRGNRKPVERMVFWWHTRGCELIRRSSDGVSPSPEHGPYCHGQREGWAWKNAYPPPGDVLSHTRGRRLYPNGWKGEWMAPVGGLDQPLGLNRAASRMDHFKLSQDRTDGAQMACALGVNQHAHQPGNRMVRGFEMHDVSLTTIIAGRVRRRLEGSEPFIRARLELAGRAGRRGYPRSRGKWTGRIPSPEVAGIQGSG